MGFQRGRALYHQVAGHLREKLLPITPIGECLPSDGELARKWEISMRTVREALLVLEAEGMVERQQGRGTVVCRNRQPVGLFSELNLLHPRTPRFFGIVLDLVAKRFASSGYETRLYTGRSEAGGESGSFSCPGLIADATAGKLAGIAAITSALKGPEFQKLKAQGLPMVALTGDVSFCETDALTDLLQTAVSYISSWNRKRVALIGWGSRRPYDEERMISIFDDVLDSHGLKFRREWCRVELSFAWSGAGWEEFREIWFAMDEKPDALVIADENYIPEVTMSVLRMGIRVPEDLLIVSHQTGYVEWQTPVPVARVQEDVDIIVDYLFTQLQAKLEGRPAKALTTRQSIYNLIPIQEPNTTDSTQITTAC